MGPITMSETADGRHVLELLDHRQIYTMLCKTIEDYCASRRIDFEQHGSHGLYYDLFYPSKFRGQKFMLDASVEDRDDPRRNERGYVVLRPPTHHYNNPKRLGSLNILSDVDASRQLDILLGIDQGA